MTNERHQGIDDRIVEAALLLIAEHGLSGVSMTRVAQSAGVARQTLYNRYPDVDSIVAAVIRSHGDEGVRQLEALLATASTATRQIGMVVEYTLATSGHDHDPVALGTALSPTARSAVEDYEARIRAVIERIIVRGRESGEFALDADPSTVATIVYSIIEGATRLVGPAGGDVDLVTTMIVAAMNPQR